MGEGEGGRGIDDTTNIGRKNMYNSLTHLTINAQSLQYKMNELREIAFQHKPQIIAVTESWEKPGIDDITFEMALNYRNRVLT